METHSYMYQIQTQLLVTEYSYCDFFVYTNKDFIRIRILPNTLIMDEIREKAQHFFIKAILPELLDKYFTNLEKMNAIHLHKRLGAIASSQQKKMI